MDNENILVIRDDIKTEGENLEHAEKNIEILRNKLKNQENAKDLILNRLAALNKDLFVLGGKDE